MTWFDRMSCLALDRRPWRLCLGEGVVGHGT